MSTDRSQDCFFFVFSLYLFTIYLATLCVPYSVRWKEEYVLQEFWNKTFLQQKVRTKGFCSFKMFKNKIFSLLWTSHPRQFVQTISRLYFWLARWGLLSSTAGRWQHRWKKWLPKNKRVCVLRWAKKEIARPCSVHFARNLMRNKLAEHVEGWNKLIVKQNFVH